MTVTHSLIPRQLVDLDGKLAQFRHAGPSWTEPTYCVSHFVSDIDASDYPDIIGQVPWSPEPGWSGQVKTGWNGTRYVDTSGWRNVTVETPIPPPRNGKTYSWTWKEGAWMKDFYPRCRQCREYHAPALVACDDCGSCHKPGKRCQS